MIRQQMVLNANGVTTNFSQDYFNRGNVNLQCWEVRSLKDIDNISPFSATKTGLGKKLSN